MVATMVPIHSCKLGLRQFGMAGARVRPSSSLSSISSEHLSPLRQRRESSDAGQGFMQGHRAGLVA